LRRVNHSIEELLRRITILEMKEEPAHGDEKLKNSAELVTIG